MGKKITKTTFKCFLKKNTGKLYIKNTADFDGMTDCVERVSNPKFFKVEQTPDFSGKDNKSVYTYGIDGLWLVGGGRDYFREYDDGEYQGIRVFNCCGEHILAVRRAA